MCSSTLDANSSPHWIKSKNPQAPGGQVRSREGLGLVKSMQRGDDADSSLAAPADSQLVQLAGMSERLPSGSTTSNSKMPRRFMTPITCSERPSNGCRSRGIVTKLDISRRWVVCDGFLRHGEP